MKEKLGYLFKNWKTVPNAMSFARILLIPVFAVLFYKGKTLAALSVLAVSGLTDMFDGKIARRFNQVSELGKILDPIADKLTIAVIAVLMFLKFWNSKDSQLHMFAWVFLVFIAKDLLMLLVGALMLALGIKPGAAEIYGKVATFVFYATMITVMGFGPEVGAFSSYYTLGNKAMMVLVVIAVVATIVALLSYVPPVLKQFSEYFSNKRQKKGSETGEKS